MDNRTSILIVEDDPDLRAIFESYFTGLNIFDNIVVAVDGIEAHFKLSNQVFDYILLDYNIPKKDAAKLLEHADKFNININQILICSGELDKIKLNKLISKGVKNFLTKPCTLKLLDKKVKTMLSKNTTFQKRKVA